MDPSELACRMYDSFTHPPPAYDPKSLPPFYSVKSPVTLELEIKTKSFVDSELDPVYGDVVSYRDLEIQKNKRLHWDEDSPSLGHVLESMSYKEAASQIDVFYSQAKGKNVFLSPQAIVLANMDAIFKFTGHYGGLLKQRMDHTYEKIGTGDLIPYIQPVGLFKEDASFLFCDLGGGPGGFTDYIQFRVKENAVYGMTLKDPLTDWKVSKLSTRYLNITYGDNGLGDVFTNGDFFINHVRSQQPEGVHLMAAHSDPTGIRKGNGVYGSEQEWQHSLTLLEEIIIGLGCCRVGGKMVLLVGDQVTHLSAQLLYVLAQCFGSIRLFKPLSTSVFTSEQYVVCLDRQSDEIVQIYLDLLKRVREEYQGLNYDLPLGFDPKNPEVFLVSSFLLDPLPTEFEEWLTLHNNFLIQYQQKSFSNMEKLVVGAPVDLVEYNVSMSLKIWSLPGDPPKLPTPGRRPVVEKRGQE